MSNKKRIINPHARNFALVNVQILLHAWINTDFEKLYLIKVLI